jgi:GMP synthase (glutamine-hydrolysing)
MEHQLVAVIDFGGQYTQLIVRRCRELGVFSEMVPWQKAAEFIQEHNPQAVILSGGPKSVHTEGSPTLDLSLLEGIPTLGICYGMQLMAHSLGGSVTPSKDREYGRRNLKSAETWSLAAALENPTIWMSHGDSVKDLPPGFHATASTDSCPIAAIEAPDRGFYGVQFHPEVTHTPDGRRLMRAFLFDIAGLKGDWSMAAFAQEQIESIRAKVGEGKALCAVSGGVDSSVAAALCAEALGDKLTCVFIDHGLLRKGEAEQVHEMFTRVFHPNLIVINARDRFLSALAGVTDPEQKRKIIGAEFVRCFEEHSADLAGCKWLVQGTLYPDVIESGSDTASTIKTHHNVGGLPDWMKMELIEPLRWLFKDEVRAVGRELGLPEDVVDREPFPGPGLAVRILGEITQERIEIVQEADAIFREEMRAQGLNKGVWQSYAALLNVRSVGVMGDERTYQEAIVLRAVESEDAMTATAVAFPHEFLAHVSSRIVNEVNGVNRVVYDLTSKPPGTIEWE